MDHENKLYELLGFLIAWWLIGLVTQLAVLFFAKERQKLGVVLSYSFYGPLITFILGIAWLIELWIYHIPESFKSKLLKSFKYINIFKLLDVDIGRSKSNKDK